MFWIIIDRESPPPPSDDEDGAPPPSDDEDGAPPPSDDEDGAPPPSDDEDGGPPPSDDEAPPISDDEFDGAPPESDDEGPPLSEDEDEDDGPPLTDVEGSIPPESDDDGAPPFSDDEADDVLPASGPPSRPVSRPPPAADAGLDVLDSLSSGLNFGNNKVPAGSGPAGDSASEKPRVMKVNEPAGSSVRASVVLPTPATDSMSVTRTPTALAEDPPAPVAAAAAAGSDGPKSYLTGPMKPLAFYRKMAEDLPVGSPNRPMYDYCNFDQSCFVKSYGKFIANPTALPAIGSKTVLKDPSSIEINDEFEPIRIYISSDEEALYVRLGHTTAVIPDASDDASVTSELTTESKNSTSATGTKKRRGPDGEGVGDILFDLRDMSISEKCYVSMVQEDRTCFRLRHKKCDIIFKMDSSSGLQKLMSQMPECVFESPPAMKVAAPTVVPVAARRPYPPPSAIERKKYTSVEDILEGLDDSSETASGAGAGGAAGGVGGPPAGPPPAHQSEVMFKPPAEGSMGSFMEASEDANRYMQRRKELLDSHIRKPKYSVRHVSQLCNWLTGLQIWPRPITINTLHKEICSGLLLARLMEYLVPGTKFIHLNEKVLTKKTAVENLEKALGVIWRSKCVNNSRIASANEVYNGNTCKIAVTLQELFEVYVRAPLFKKAIKILTWFNVTLKQYGKPLPEEIFTEGDLSHVWPYFQSGSALFNIFYHHFGPIAIGEGSNLVRIDPLRIVLEPARISDFRANVNYVFSLMKAAKITNIWDTESWITFPDTESVLLQLSFIYETFKDRGCCLAPASGTSAGVTAGPGGEMLVIGLIYADSRPINSRTFQRRHRTVLLGSGQDCLPVLPIDIGSAAGRFNSTSMPKGLISQDAKFIHTSVKMVPGQRALSERKGWNSSNLIQKIEEQQAGSRTLSVLKSLNSTDITTSNENMSIDKAMTMTMKSSVPLGKKSSDLDKMRAQMAAEQEKRQEKQSANIISAMENLEVAMNEADKEIEAMEEELERQYVDLENRVSVVSKVEYSCLLEALDMEAKHIETEKCRLQEHFSLCLSSIRLQYQEESARINALADEEARKLQELEGLKKVASRSKYEAENQKHNATATKQQKALLEKKWISESRPFTSKSHNYHLQKKQAASVMNTQKSWEPPSAKARREKEAQAQAGVFKSNSVNEAAADGSSFSPRSPMRASKQPTMQVTYDSGRTAKVELNSSLVDQDATTPAQVFNLFKQQLKADTVKWYSDSAGSSVSVATNGSRRRMSVKDIMAETNVNTPKKKIPLIYKATASFSGKITGSTHAHRPTSLSATVANFNGPATPKANKGKTPKSPSQRKTAADGQAVPAAAAADAPAPTPTRDSTGLSHLPWDEIRSHELLCMKYEDDRRRLVLAQGKPVTSGPQLTSALVPESVPASAPSNEPPATSVHSSVPTGLAFTAKRASASYSYSYPSSKDGSVRVDEEDEADDVDFDVSRPTSTTSFMMDSRPNTAASAASVGDRSEISAADLGIDEDDENAEIPPIVVHPHDVTEDSVSRAIDALSSRVEMPLVGRKLVNYDWCINSVIQATPDISDIDEGDDGDVADYELTWYRGQEKEGCVSLLDIVSINISPHDTVNIVVSDEQNPNPKALKRSGGRPVVSIGCGSLQASLTFNQHLEVLRLVLL